LSASVLDASSLLAYLQDEEGADEVEEALAQRATIGAANLAETLSTIAQHGGDPRTVVTDLRERGVLDGLLNVEPLTIEDAIAIAEMRPPTKDYGLSLGDRACLALAVRLGLPVITADRVWIELRDALGVEVYAFRG
jgi:ribonuclease VapC